MSPPPAAAPEATRRTALRLLAALGLYGLTTPAHAADAAGWPDKAFHAKTLDEALEALYGAKFELSDKVSLDVPDIAENGAVVPVSVAAKLDGVTAIAILVPENPFVLAAAYTLPAGAMPQVACRLKMAKTTKVIAVVQAGGKLYAAAGDVKVTLGGCGG